MDKHGGLRLDRRIREDLIQMYKSRSPTGSTLALAKQTRLASSSDNRFMR